jgi:SynChlorMet cassette protein ScmD
MKRKENAVDVKKPIANPLIVLREEFDDWAILFDPDTGNAFGLNPTGVFIWKLLDGLNSLEDVLDRLRESAEGVPEKAGEEIDGFVSALESAGLVGYERDSRRKEGRSSCG